MRGARLEKRLRRVQAARDCYQRAVEAEPDSYYAWHCWAMLEADLRNFNDARQLFHRGWLNGLKTGHTLHDLTTILRR